MNYEQLETFARIQEFQLDHPGASFPFSKKLAQENHWTSQYASRVMDEYKRFAFLAVASGHPVSPSDAVDQAWHMHLIYTQNYWKVFCPEVLRTPFHHNPTQGGGAERDKFDDWYRMTLESYRSLFGDEPPSDIWPSPDERLVAPPQVVRVDRSSHWVIRKPKLPADWRFGAVTLVSLFMVGCAGANPFDWNGPEFLRFYVWLYPASLAIALWVRYALRTPISGGSGPGHHLTAYQMAYLNGGKWLAINAAIASLVHRKALTIVPGKKQLIPAQALNTGSDDLERLIFDLANQPWGVSVRDVRTHCTTKAESIAAELRQFGMVPTDVQSTRMIGISLAIASVALIVGVLKIFVGVSRGKPVEYLTFLCFFTTTVTLIALCRRPLRTRYGDTVLEQLRARFAHLQHLGHHQFSVAQDDLLTGVSLFGMQSLVGSDMAYLTASLNAPPPGSSGCSSSVSSCGGGGGDGGGGGGGGCGGCGGG